MPAAPTPQRGPSFTPYTKPTRQRDVAPPTTTRSLAQEDAAARLKGE